MSDEILLSTVDGIATVTLNRPEKRNAINYGMWQRLPGIWSHIDNDPKIRAVLITGMGDEAFSAGADIGEFERYRGNSRQGKQWGRVLDEALEGLNNLTKPTIAVIKGYCIGGGCELAAFADMRFAAENARFGITAARLGIVLGYRETRRLIQLVGPANASYILLSARHLDAKEALLMGLVNLVLPLEHLADYTNKLVMDIAALAPLSHKGNKEVIRINLVNPSLEGLSQAQEEVPFGVFDSDDFREGRSAFIEKRRPKFEGK
jgi:enoyl-CoA hydratase